MTPEAVGERLAARYRDIEAKAMRDAPICNGALAVEAIGFREFAGHVIGVVATPWFLNLVAAPSVADEAPKLRGCLLRLSFPAGAVDFTVTEVDGFGRLGVAALISPMFDFPDQDAAHAAAVAALTALFDSKLHSATFEARAKPALDRRAFLTGRPTDQGSAR
jgi:[NiFe] hydrogenase assembly HybE family chaperone